jgi:hypothetical protein
VRYCPACGRPVGAVAGASARAQAARRATPAVHPPAVGSPAATGHTPAPGLGPPPAAGDRVSGDDFFEAVGTTHSQVEAEVAGSGSEGRPPRRALFGGLAVAAALVIIAVVAGGSSDPGADASATSRATSTTASSTTEARRTTTTRSVTTAPRETTPTQPPVHVPWLPELPGVELVMGTRDGDVLRVDLASGRTSVLRTGIANFGSNVSPDAARVIGEHLVISDGPSPRVLDLRTAEVFDLDIEGVDGGICGVHGSEAPDRVWLQPCGENGQPGEMIEFSLTDRNVTATVPIPPDAEYLVGYAPGVGAVLQAAGGIYVVDRDGAVTRRSTGRILGLVGDTVLRRECDDALLCANTLVDLATGDERSLTIDPALSDRVDGIPGWGGPSGSHVRALVWMTGDGGQGFMAVLDVESGAISPLPEEHDFAPYDDNGQPVWTTDGQWLFDRSGRGVWAFHVADGRLVELDDVPGTRLWGVVAGAQPVPVPQAAASPVTLVDTEPVDLDVTFGTLTRRTATPIVG